MHYHHGTDCTLSDQRVIIVFDRTVTRDDSGQIIDEQYFLSPILLPDPGFTTGLAVE